MSSRQVFSPPSSRRAGKRGLLIPAFIHNADYFLDEVPVFEDGIAECWGSVDLDFLRKKLESGWLTSVIPEGGSCNIYRLGEGKVKAAEWEMDNEQLHTRIIDTLKTLNPQMAELYDFEGEDYETVDGHLFPKIMPWDNSVQRVVDGSEIKGGSRWLLKPEDGVYQLTPMRIFSDAMIDVHPTYGENELVTIDGLEGLLACGQLAVTAPDGSWFSVDGLGKFQLEEIWWNDSSWIDFLNEVDDILRRVQGKKTPLQQFHEAWSAYRATPIVANREVLRQTYEAIPEHEQAAVGDAIPIRMVLYGELLD